MDPLVDFSQRLQRIQDRNGFIMLALTPDDGEIKIGMVFKGFWLIIGNEKTWLDFPATVIAIATKAEYDLHCVLNGLRYHWELEEVIDYVKVVAE